MDSDRLPRWQGWTIALLAGLLSWTLIFRWVALLSTEVQAAPAAPAPLQEHREPEAPKVTGMVRSLHGRTACAAWSPLPFLVAEQRPRVGQPWRIAFLTSACPVPAEPDWPMWILASFRHPPASYPLDLTQYGFRGCWLHLQPDFVIPSWPVVEGDEQEGLLTRIPERGRTLLHWTPPAGFAGLQIWFQVVVAGPRGIALSHAVQVTIGS